MLLTRVLLLRGELAECDALLQRCISNAKETKASCTAPRTEALQKKAEGESSQGCVVPAEASRQAALLLLFARCCHLRGDFDVGLDHLQRAVELFPRLASMPACLLLKGTVYMFFAVFGADPSLTTSGRC